MSYPGQILCSDLLPMWTRYYFPLNKFLLISNKESYYASKCFHLFFNHIFVMKGLPKMSYRQSKHWGYYMATQGYEFYLLVLKVSLMSEQNLLMRYFQHEKIKFIYSSNHVMFCLFYRYWWNFYIKDNFLIHFQNSKIVQLKWSPIAKCLSQKCYETQI